MLVSVSPRLPSSSPPVLIPCPSASALACRRRRRRFLSLAHQRPPSPAVVVAAGSRPLPVSVPSPDVVVDRTSAVRTLMLHFCRLVNTAAMVLRYLTEVQKLPKAPPKHMRRNPFRKKKRQKKSIFIYGTTFKKNPDLERSLTKTKKKLWQAPSRVVYLLRSAKLCAVHNAQSGIPFGASRCGFTGGTARSPLYPSLPKHT